MTTAGSRDNDSGRLWLVRHASTAWTGRRFCGRTDLPLSQGGRAEAAALAERLTAIVPDDARVASGPARRAHETAERLLASLRGHGHVELDDRLREVDFGRAEGLTFDGIVKTMPVLAAAITSGDAIDWPGGESAASVRERAGAVWGDVHSAVGPMLLVTHGGFIRALLDVALGPRPLPNVWIGPTALIELRRTAGQWQAIGP